ncbi:hypothetical protein D4Q52_20775 [Rhodopseudomonas palustris]|uniref:Uncharacterized protein n=1 Tax=Rhodopseudomonas palustris TaxID=1076 RepID=A0A418V0V5_RHOPL|nr:hypothetical protein D4Q52_20775 [Rhodopseudomonas palustris]
MRLAEFEPLLRCLVCFGYRHGRACPGHPRLCCISFTKAWMPGTRPGMTCRKEGAKVKVVHSGEALR